MTDDSRSFAPDLARLTDAADDSFSVRRAYGEAYEHQGQLIIPVAKVWGGIGTGSGGGTGTGSANGTGTGSGNGTGSGSGRGTGKSSGEGSAPGWRRSFRFGSGSTDAAAEPSAEPAESSAEPATTDAAAGGPGHGPGAHGDASGEAQGDAQGELKGELSGEARGEGHGEGGGGGGGYGLRVKPLGVVVVSAEGTRYQPVLDLNRVILGGQAVGIAVALAAGWAIGRRRR
ncbi:MULTISPECIES: hypothetical protein [unclassified Isoptericola]|uniref:hypothetical protein n=1 Tax=Isoptericola sp. NPDC057191 TaxID=3346041 RepID=UPI0036253B21